MNCTCISDIEKQFIGREYGDKKNKITEASIPVSFRMGENSISTVTSTKVELTVENYKRPQWETLVHSYCPFCGKKIELAIVKKGDME